MTYTLTKLPIERRAIKHRINELGGEIAGFYSRNIPKVDDDGLIILTVLKGAMIFAADLIRALYHYEIPLELEFVGIKSYLGKTTVSNAPLRQYVTPERNLHGKHVLIVEDIVDSGYTLKHLHNYLKSEHVVQSLTTCTLLNKVSRRTVDVPIEFTGFYIGDAFAIGYGLDYDERFRELGYIEDFQARD